MFKIKFSRFVAATLGIMGALMVIGSQGDYGIIIFGSLLAVIGTVGFFMLGDE